MSAPRVPVGRYDAPVLPNDYVYTVAEFRRQVEKGFFIDYDGFGHPVRDGLADESDIVKPSRVKEIPPDATHIVWFNR